MVTTTNFGLTKPTVGGDVNNWGDLLNTNMDLIDAALFGRQPLNGRLTGISALGAASAGVVPYGTGTDTFGWATLTAFARTILDDANAAEVRATIGALDASLVSTFIITLLNDADAATARATLEAAPLNSPTFTGDPKAPTPATSDNDTTVATTAFVKAVALEAAVSTAVNSIGAYVFASCAVDVAFGSTVSGTSLQPTSAAWNVGVANDANLSFNRGAVLSGTWVCCGTADTIVESPSRLVLQGATLFRKIAD